MFIFTIKSLELFYLIEAKPSVNKLAIIATYRFHVSYAKRKAIFLIVLISEVSKHKYLPDYSLKNLAGD